MEPADLMLVGFKNHLRVRTIPAEAVCLVSERGVTALSGSSIEKLAPLLDGTRTPAQIRRELAADLSAEDVDQLLAQLAAAGVIKIFPAQKESRSRAGTAGPGGLPVPVRADDRILAYWDSADLDSHHVMSALASAPVSVVSTGSTEAAGVVAACRESGLTVVDTPDGAAFSLVLCDDYLDPILDQINAYHLASRRPWLLARPAGAVAWIGPVFQPRAGGACWACLAKRLAGNRPGEVMVRQAAQASGTPLPMLASLPASQAAGLQLTVLEAMKWLAGFRHEGQQGICTLDTLTLRTTSHPVMRRPQCPACGDHGLVASQLAKPFSLSVRAIAGQHGNGQRTAGLTQVLERYRHLIDPVTGIVPELRRNPGCPDFLHCYLSGRNRAMAATTVSVLRAGLRANSGGKGVTELEAKVGALCEAVERYCATRDGDEPTVRDSYHGLGDIAVHPHACQLFHPRQHVGRDHWNAVCAPFHFVPQPFDERQVTDWTGTWSLLDGRRRLLPTAMLYFNPDPGRGPVSVIADSNGNAAGTSLEDAIMQGFFELVERDALAIWWYNRTRQPSVDLDSFDDPWVAEFRDRLRRLNRQVWVLDVTSDLGVPAMAAVSRRIDKPAEDIMFGFGAHPDPHIALRRSLTELAQMLPAVIDVRADGSGYRTAAPYLLSWWTQATTRSEPYLLPDPSLPPRTAASYGYVPCQYLDVSGICAIAQRAGLDVLVVDQTRPDIGMPVVKVVVPGLRHFWPRFAPGRLFDVPVRLGRMAEPTSYDNLNPIPIYL